MTNFSCSRRESSRLLKSPAGWKAFLVGRFGGAGLICIAVLVGRVSLCSEGAQAGQSGEVAGGDSQGEAGADAFNAARHRLLHAADGLGPPKGSSIFFRRFCDRA